MRLPWLWLPRIVKKGAWKTERLGELGEGTGEDCDRERQEGPLSTASRQQDIPVISYRAEGYGGTGLPLLWGQDPAVSLLWAPLAPS